MSSNPWITGVETIKRQTRTAHGCSVAGQSPVSADLAYTAYRPYARSVCDTTDTTAAAFVVCGAI